MTKHVRRHFDAATARDAMRAIDPPVDREDWVHLSMAIKSAGVDLDEWLAWCERGSNFVLADAKAVWRSISPSSGGGGIGPGLLFKRALEAGWNPPPEDESRPRRARPTYHPAIDGQHSDAQPNGRDRNDSSAAATEKEESLSAEAVVRRLQQVDALFEKAVPAPAEHPYLVRKRVGPEGLRVATAEQVKQALGYVPQNRGQPLAGQILLVPLADADSPKLAGMELIDEAGRKSAVAGLPRKGLAWYPAYRIRTARKIGFAEGLATAKTLVELLPYPVISVGSCHNFKDVMAAVARANPHADFVVFADLGNGQAAAEDAADEHFAPCVAPPLFLAEPFACDELPEGGTDFNDLSIALGHEGTRIYVQRRDRHPARIDVAAAAEAKVEIDWVLPGLAVGDVGLMVGQGAVGKSMLSVQFAAGFALGRNLICADDSLIGDSPFDPIAGPGRVGVLFGEDSHGIVHNRLHDVIRTYQLDAVSVDRLDERLGIWTMPGYDMRVIAQDRSGPMLAHFAATLRRFARGRRLIIIDPLVRLHDADEADNAVASHLMLQLQQVAAEAGCAIIILHHVSKAGGTDWRAARGAGAYSTSVRWQLMLRPPLDEEASANDWNEEMRERMVLAKTVKLNNSGRMRPLWLMRDENGLLRVPEPSVFISGSVLSGNQPTPPPRAHGPSSSGSSPRQPNWRTRIAEQQRLEREGGAGSDD